MSIPDSDKGIGEPADQVISIGEIECKPVEADEILESGKALGGVIDDPLTPEIEDDLASTDDYDALRMDDLADPDFSPAAWGKEIE